MAIVLIAVANLSGGAINFPSSLCWVFCFLGPSFWWHTFLSLPTRSTLVVSRAASFLVFDGITRLECVALIMQTSVCCLEPTVFSPFLCLNVLKPGPYYGSVSSDVMSLTSWQERVVVGTQEFYHSLNIFSDHFY